MEVVPSYDVDVLGICGREGAGKTTVANILTGGSSARFEAREITDPIRYIVHILFGFSLNGTISDQNEKDAIWNISYQEAVGHVISLLHSHVDTQWCSKFPQREDKPYIAYFSTRGSPSSKRTWAEFSFADALKQIAAIIFDLDFNMLLAQTPEDRERRENEKTQDFNKCGAITGRYALEYLGTDVFRNHFDNDVWIKIAQRDSQAWINAGGKVVIPDVRFPNELEFINSFDKGHLLVMFRDPQELLLTTADRASHPAKWKFLDFCGDAKKLVMLHNRIRDHGIMFLKGWVITNFCKSPIQQYRHD